MTDFSMFIDFPLAVNVYNYYRNHLLARFYQDRGVNIIPTLLWSDERTLDWCCDGYEKGGTFAIPMISVVREKECNDYFYKGLEHCINKLKPDELIIFTKSDRVLEKDYGIKVSYVDTSYRTKMDQYSNLKKEGL